MSTIRDHSYLPSNDQRDSLGDLGEMRNQVDTLGCYSGSIAMYCNPVVALVSTFFARVPTQVQSSVSHVPFIAFSSIPSLVIRFSDVMATYRDSTLKQLRQAVIVGDIYYYTLLGATGIASTLHKLAEYKWTFDVMFGGYTVFRMIEMRLIYQKMQHIPEIEDRLKNHDLSEKIVLGETFTDEELIEYFMVSPSSLGQMKEDAKSCKNSDIYSNLFERFHLSKKMDKWKMAAAAIAAVAGVILAVAYFCPLVAPVAGLLYIISRATLLTSTVMSLGIWANTAEVESRPFKSI